MKRNRTDGATTRRIAEILFQARRRKGLKQEVLAPLVGCSRSYISKLEKGESLPSCNIALRFEKVLTLRAGVIVKIIQAIKIKESKLKQEAVRVARSGLHSKRRNGFDRLRPGSGRR